MRGPDQLTLSRDLHRHILADLQERNRKYGRGTKFEYLPTDERLEEAIRLFHWYGIHLDIAPWIRVPYPEGLANTWVSLAIESFQEAS